jgi:hypothetical protein
MGLRGPGRLSEAAQKEELQKGKRAGAFGRRGTLACKSSLFFDNLAEQTRQMN